jgi:hypothetical protein
LDVSSAGVKDTSAPAVGIEQGALSQFLFEALARSFLGRADRAPPEVDEAIALDSFRPWRVAIRRHGVIENDMGHLKWPPRQAYWTMLCEGAGACAGCSGRCK